MNESEKRFFESHRKQYGIELEYHTRRISVLVDRTLYSYQPDFYCPVSGSYYEVVGTRQAYSANRHKVVAVQEQYPDLKFFIVRPDGSPYVSQKKRIGSKLNQAPKVSHRGGELMDKKLHNLNIRLGDDLKKKIEDTASLIGVKDSEIVRRTLEYALDIPNLTELLYRPKPRIASVTLQDEKRSA